MTGNDLIIVEQSAYDQLRPSERLFVDTYLRHDETRNGIAGFTSQEASRYLARPLVRTAIYERRQQLADKLNIDATNILREISKLAFANMQDFVDEEGCFEPSKLNRTQWAAVHKIKRTKRYDKDGNLLAETLEAELHPKLPALSELMKYLEKYAPTVFKAMMEDANNPAEAYARMINA